MKIKRILCNIKALYKNTFITPNCPHTISLNKVCWRIGSAEWIIVLVWCDNCGRIIQVKWDDEYIEKIYKIMKTY